MTAYFCGSGADPRRSNFKPRLEGREREEILTDAVYRYSAGERVVYQPSEPSPHFAGPYLVEQRLPVTGTEARYKIKSIRDGHERVVAERELAPVTPSEPTPPRRRPRKA
jgi:hypothetical protein